MTELQDFLALAGPALAKFGPMGGLAALLMFAIRLYQLPGIQTMLPSRARWDRLTPVAKVALPFLLSLAGSLLLAVLGGATVLSSLPAAIGVALGAIGLHHATKAVGSAMYDRELKSNSRYEPTPLRKSAGLIVPLPHLPPLGSADRQP